MKIGISGNNRKIGVKMLTFANLFRECEIELQISFQKGSLQFGQEILSEN